MGEQKILDSNQISWYGDGDTRLDYQVAFSNKGDHKCQTEGEHEESKEDKQIDVSALLRERDARWKKRLKKAREASFAKGFRDGKKQGAEEALKEADKRVNAIEKMFEEAHQEWVSRHEALNPGLLDLVFELAETIMGLPVGAPEVRENMEDELSALLYEVEDHLRPVLWVCEHDFRFIEKLVNKYAHKTTVDIRVSNKCKPGEFEFETDKEKVVHNFQEMLKDFKDNLSLPTWK